MILEDDGFGMEDFDTSEIVFEPKSKMVISKSDFENPDKTLDLEGVFSIKMGTPDEDQVALEDLLEQDSNITERKEKRYDSYGTCPTPSDDKIDEMLREVEREDIENETMNLILTEISKGDVGPRNTHKSPEKFKYPRSTKRIVELWKSRTSANNYKLQIKNGCVSIRAKTPPGRSCTRMAEYEASRILTTACFTSNLAWCNCAKHDFDKVPKVCTPQFVKTINLEKAARKMLYRKETKNEEQLYIQHRLLKAVIEFRGTFCECFHLKCVCDKIKKFTELMWCIEMTNQICRHILNEEEKNIIGFYRNKMTEFQFKITKDALPELKMPSDVGLQKLPILDEEEILEQSILGKRKLEKSFGVVESKPIKLLKVPGVVYESSRERGLRVCQSEIEAVLGPWKKVKKQNKIIIIDFKDTDIYQLIAYLWQLETPELQDKRIAVNPKYDSKKPLVLFQMLRNLITHYGVKILNCFLLIDSITNRVGKFIFVPTTAHLKRIKPKLENILKCRNLFSDEFHMYSVAPKNLITILMSSKLDLVFEDYYGEKDKKKEITDLNVRISYYLLSMIKFANGKKLTEMLSLLENKATNLSEKLDLAGCNYNIEKFFTINNFEENKEIQILIPNQDEELRNFTVNLLKKFEISHEYLLRQLEQKEGVDTVMNIWRILTRKQKNPNITSNPDEIKKDLWDNNEWRKRSCGCCWYWTNHIWGSYKGYDWWSKLEMKLLKSGNEKLELSESECLKAARRSVELVVEILMCLKEMKKLCSDELHETSFNQVKLDEKDGGYGEETRDKKFMISFCQSIKRLLTMSNTKETGLIVTGESSAGKTFLSSILKDLFPILNGRIIHSKTGSLGRDRYVKHIKMKIVEEFKDSLLESFKTLQLNQTEIFKANPLQSRGKFCYDLWLMEGNNKDWNDFIKREIKMTPNKPPKQIESEYKQIWTRYSILDLDSDLWRKIKFLGERIKDALKDLESFKDTWSLLDSCCKTWDSILSDPIFLPYHTNRNKFLGDTSFGLMVRRIRGCYKILMGISLMGNILENLTPYDCEPKEIELAGFKMISDLFK
jgi:hypothetical protein